MRRALIVLLLFSTLVIGTAFVYVRSDREMIPLKLHIDSIIVDSHNDTMMKIVDENTWLPVIDLRGETSLQIDFKKLRAGNLSVPFFAAYSSPFYGNPDRSISRTAALFNALYHTQKNNSDLMEIASSYSEIERIVLKKKFAAVPTIEGAYSVSKVNATELIKQYDDLKVKAIGFTWNYSNELGEGLYRAYGDRDGSFSHGGLTELGRQTVKQMNSLGMIVDVSHLAETTFWDVIETTELPIIASHSGAMSVHMHARNMTDDQIKAVGENGGVVSAVFFTEFIGKKGEASVSKIVDHIDHIVKIAGVDHAGLGSDFDGADMPEDLKDATGIYKITEELAKRGYNEKDIKKILGLNLLRVIRENDKARKPDVGIEGLSIKPLFEMGDAFADKRPILRAEVKDSSGKDIDYRVIINGIPKEVKVENNLITYEIENILKEKFYIFTFEALSAEGGSVRETRIFRIEGN
ncbi:MAG: dipeptidase [Gudongella sp.]|jgi:membrane dipeptidase|nr:dipeptidase [Gudongella sp.]